MIKFEHPWNLSISQNVLYYGKSLFGLGYWNVLQSSVFNQSVIIWLPLNYHVLRKERTWRVASHIWNLCSAFNLCSLLTHTAVRSEQTHTHTHTHTHGAVGSQCKGLTSFVVLRVERVLDIHPHPHWQSLPDMRFKPETFGLQVRLFNH